MTVRARAWTLPHSQTPTHQLGTIGSGDCENRRCGNAAEAVECSTIIHRSFHHHLCCAFISHTVMAVNSRAQTMSRRLRWAGTLALLMPRAMASQFYSLSAGTHFLHHLVGFLRHDLYLTAVVPPPPTAVRLAPASSTGLAVTVTFPPELPGCHISHFRSAFSIFSSKSRPFTPSSPLLSLAISLSLSLSS